MLKEVIQSLEEMELSYNSGVRNVKRCSNNLEIALHELKNKSLTGKLEKSDQLQKVIKLIEKLSILNEFKLDLFKDFSTYYFQKK